MSCNDPYLKYLKSLGYNVIRLPKADVRPLQLLARHDGDLQRIGELVTILVSRGNRPLPKVIENTRAANVSGQRSGDLSLGLGLSILGNILGAMGGSGLGLETKFQLAKSITFEFQDVLEDRVEIAALDQYLADADVSPFSRHVATLLEADELYVTTATIKSSKLTVAAKGTNGATVDVKVPEIQGVVGANVKVSGKAERASTVTFEGPIPLAFGFQAIQLVYEQGRYVRFESVDESMTLERAGAPTPKVAVLSPAPFVRVRDL